MKFSYIRYGFCCFFLLSLQIDRVSKKCEEKVAAKKCFCVLCCFIYVIFFLFDRCGCGRKPIGVVFSSSSFLFVLQSSDFYFRFCMFRTHVLSILLLLIVQIILCCAIINRFDTSNCFCFSHVCVCTVQVSVSERELVNIFVDSFANVFRLLFK